jgi:hypothetical protein
MEMSRSNSHHCAQDPPLYGRLRMLSSGVPLVFESLRLQADKIRRLTRETPNWLSTANDHEPDAEHLSLQF